MRRCVETGLSGIPSAMAMCSEKGLGEGASAAFPFRARYVNDIEVVDVSRLRRRSAPMTVALVTYRTE